MKQLKDAAVGEGACKMNGGGAPGPSKASQREVAALSVEHEMLTTQVAEMKQFLAVN